jgi:hypothetical protein
MEYQNPDSICCSVWRNQLARIVKCQPQIAIAGEQGFHIQEIRGRNWVTVENQSPVAICGRPRPWSTAKQKQGSYDQQQRHHPEPFHTEDPPFCTYPPSLLTVGIPIGSPTQDEAT